MLFISYYTKDTPYKALALEKLKPTLIEHDLEYYIGEVPDLGNWYLNTEYKATFIKDCLLKFKRDIVFTDADSEIVEHPELFFNIPKEYDIAVHYMDWCLQWREQTDGDIFELLSGTMMFRYNDTVLGLCDNYINECNSHTTIEQKVLQNILEKNKLINVYQLPAEYCTVVLHNNSIPKYITKPVVLHSQASRKYKNK